MSVILPPMKRKPRIAIVGPGSLGSALALSLHEKGYSVSEIVVKGLTVANSKTKALAAKVGARINTMESPNLVADLVWLCVPDRAIGPCATKLADALSAGPRIAFHSSGALSSGELRPLRKKGAAVASVHPLMTFVPGSRPALEGVPFAMEGDAAAVRAARGIIRDLGGQAFSILKRDKAAYHAWGAFASPLLIAELVTAERVAGAAGISPARARKMVLPIVRQTIANYARLGPSGAFSGPIIRGDGAILQKHLAILKRAPAAREVYLVLAHSALKSLPARNRKLLERILG